MFGDRIKTMRQEQGLTQYELAEKIGLTVDMVRSLEGNRKKPSIETLANLSIALDCSTDYLLGKTDDPQIVVPWSEEEKTEIVKKLDELEKSFPEYNELTSEFLDNAREVIDWIRRNAYNTEERRRK